MLDREHTEQEAPGSLRRQIASGFVIARLIHLVSALKHPLSSELRKQWRRRIMQKTAAQNPTDKVRRIYPCFDHKAEREFIEVQSARYSSERDKIDAVKVSVILPTYNREDTIAAAVQSVLDQSHQNWELIIVDDGSADNTFAKLEQFRTDPRIRIVRAPHEGVSAARNKGLAAAGGEILAYMDSDNTWTRDYLRMMLVFMLSHAFDCAYAGERIIRDDGSTRGYRGQHFDWQACLVKNYIDLNTFMHRAALYRELGGFDPNLRRVVDWDLILRYTKNHATGYAPFIGCDYYDRKALTSRITNKEPISYRYKVIEKHLVDWDVVFPALSARDPELVSIIVPALQNPQSTRKCVESILKHSSGFKVEIIVVGNDGSEPDTREFDARSNSGCAIRRVTTSADLTFSLASNLGYSLSNGGYIVCLDDRLVVARDWLRPLIKPLSEDERTGAVGPKLIDQHDKVQHCGIVFSDNSKVPYHLYRHFDASHPAVNRPREFQAIAAECIALRAADFAAVRGFDTLYSSGCEGLDLCFRLRLKLGKNCFYNPLSTVYRLEERDEAQGNLVQQDRQLFVTRWREHIVADDKTFFDQDGFSVLRYERKDDAANSETASYVPVLGQLVA